MKTIKIACKGSDVKPYSELAPLQGELKSLSKDNYEKLKSQMLKHGFTAPVHIWTDPKAGLSHIIDGHQRLRVVGKLANEGYAIPPLPVVNVLAGSLQEAKEILLAHASAYGKLENQGLYEFLEDMDLGYEEALANVDFPGLDLKKFGEEFYKDPDELAIQSADEDNTTEEVGTVGASPVRMIQLFYNENTILEFQRLAAMLGARWKFDNPTDTVLKALQECEDIKTD